MDNARGEHLNNGSAHLDEGQPLTNCPRLPILDLLRSRSLLCPLLAVAAIRTIVGVGNLACWPCFDTPPRHHTIHVSCASDLEDCHTNTPYDCLIRQFCAMMMSWCSLDQKAFSSVLTRHHTIRVNCASANIPYNCRICHFCAMINSSFF